jgi:hypothetical protein
VAVWCPTLFTTGQRSLVDGEQGGSVPYGSAAAPSSASMACWSRPRSMISVTHPRPNDGLPGLLFSGESLKIQLTRRKWSGFGVSVSADFLMTDVEIGYEAAVLGGADRGGAEAG